MGKRLKYILPLFALLSLAACIDDKGKYDYGDVGEADIEIPGITDDDSFITYERFNTVKITPSITHDGEEVSGNFDYRWVIFPQSPVLNDDNRYPDPKEIGTARELNYRLEENPGDYYVTLCATHKQTKATTYKRFQFKVGVINGWLVLDEDADGGGDLHVIRDPEIWPGLQAASSGVVNNLFSDGNNGRKIANATFLGQRAKILWGQSYNNVFVYTPDNYYQLDNRSYEVMSEDIKNIFVNAPKAYAPQAHYYATPERNQVEVFINDNEVRTIQWSMMAQTDRYGTSLGSFGVGYKVQPFIAGIRRRDGYGSSNVAVLYSNAGSFATGAFLAVSSGGSLVMAMSTDGPFQVRKINETAETDMQLQTLMTGPNDMACAIFRDALDDGHPWMYVVDYRMGNLGTLPVAWGKFDLKGLAEIDNATVFAFGLRGNLAFYAGSSKVYGFGFTAPESVGKESTVLELGTGETVAVMKVLDYPDNEDYNGRLLFVATNSPSGGRVYKIRFHELTGAVQKTETFTGFGTIRDMMMKFQ